MKRTLKAIDLHEVSLVTFPADKFARVTGVKSAIDAPPAKTYTAADQVRDVSAMLCRTMNANNRSGWYRRAVCGSSRHFTRRCRCSTCQCLPLG